MCAIAQPVDKLLSSQHSLNMEAQSNLKKRSVPVSLVNCRWLYNQVQASRGLILIDTRATFEHHLATLPFSISIPPQPLCQSIDQLMEVIDADDSAALSKRALRDIVLFGPVLRCATQNVNMPYESASDSESDMWIFQLAHLFVLDQLVTSVKIFSDGFSTFYHRYPFLTSSCLSKPISQILLESGSHRVNYPNIVLEGFLFLGNMWHAQCPEIIQHLGITHIVNATLDSDNVFENKGVLYHCVKIKDLPESDIALYFDSTYKFIEDAKRTQHGRVLVHCTQGISRSATLVIMYLMRANQWSLVTAMNFCVASRGVVYPNQGFLRTLMQEELRLYHGNSVNKDELDSLVQNQIPDRPLPLETYHTGQDSKCASCSKLFALLEWKRKCNFCRKEFCSACSSLRVSTCVFDKAHITEETGRTKRLCDVCVTRLEKIQLPRPKKMLHSRNPQIKCLHISGVSTMEKPWTVSYFEGTDTIYLMEILRKRFKVQSNQIIEAVDDEGNFIQSLKNLPDDLSITVSIGKAGTVNEHESTRHQVADDIPLLQLLRRKPKQEKSKFENLWKLSFPNIECISQNTLLQLEPSLLMDFLLGISNLACGTTKLEKLDDTLAGLGHATQEREAALSLLKAFDT